MALGIKDKDQLPADLLTRQAELLRKRAIVDALTKQSLADYEPTVQAGRVVVPNWGDAIAQVARSYMAGRSDKKQREAEAQFRTDTEERRKLAMAGLLESFNPNTVGNMFNPPRPKTAQEARAERMDAYNSGFSLVSDLAKTAMEQQDIKGQITPANLLAAGVLPQSALAFQDDRNALNLRPVPKMLTADGTALAVSPWTGEPMGDRFGISQFTQVDMGGGVKGNRNVATNELQAAQNFAPPAAATASREFSKDLYKGMAKKILERKDKIQDLSTAVPYLKDMGTIAKQASLGMFGDIKLWVPRFARALGIATPADIDKVASTEMVAQIMTPFMQTVLSKFGVGTGLSDEDRRAAEIAVGMAKGGSVEALQVAAQIMLAGYMNTAYLQDEEIGRVGGALDEALSAGKDVELSDMRTLLKAANAPWTERMGQIEKTPEFEKAYKENDVATLRRLGTEAETAQMGIVFDPVERRFVSRDWNKLVRGELGQSVVGQTPRPQVMQGVQEPTTEPLIPAPKLDLDPKIWGPRVIQPRIKR